MLRIIQIILVSLGGLGYCVERDKLFPNYCRCNYIVDL